MNRNHSPGPTIGGELAHYRVLDRIGKGAMGEIFLAEDTKLGRRVALKVLPAGTEMDQHRIERFRLEARAVAAMNHPNIVTIHGVEEADGVHFLAMELVEGRTLRDVIPRGGLPFEEFLRIATELTQAVSAAHAAGVTHRDLKPENVMITSAGGVKVLDFGLAKVVDRPRIAQDCEAVRPAVPAPEMEILTRDDMLIGTVPYMSPEHIAGRDIDHRSDLFSLAIILHEMLTGERPFHGENAAGLMASILSEKPRPITPGREDVPEHLSFAIALCLEKDPARRLQSAQSLYEQLRILRRQQSSGAIPTGDSLTGSRTERPRASAAGWARTRRSLQRHRMPLALLAVVFAVNLVETLSETALRTHTGLGLRLESGLARAAHWFEGSWVVPGWDLAPPIVIYGYSAAYFFAPLVLVFATGIAFARKPTRGPFRRFSLSIAAAYAISLPFFLLFPVPERWAWPDSGAILLSDLWAPRLIEIFRPISGLNNCFPSFHVSLTTVIVGLCFIEKLQHRWAAFWLGLLVTASTLVLGIHWMTDVVAGLATGGLAIAASFRLDRGIRRRRATV